MPGDEALTSEAPNEVASRYYALATQSFVIASTLIHTKEIDDLMGNLPPYSAFVEYGGGAAAIFGPNGKQLTEKLPKDAEGLVYAELNLEKLVDCKYQIDPAGHYSNKTLTMTVDRRPKPVATFVGEETVTSMGFEMIQAED